MITVIELVSEGGAVVYLVPDHVVSVAAVPGAEARLCDVTLVGDACWRVRGEPLSVAAHIFGLVKGANGHRYAAIVRPGSALRYEQAPADCPGCDAAA